MAHSYPILGNPVYDFRNGEELAREYLTELRGSRHPDIQGWMARLRGNVLRGFLAGIEGALLDAVR